MQKGAKRLPKKRENMRLFIEMLKGISMWPKWRTGFWFSVRYYGIMVLVLTVITCTDITLLVTIATSGGNRDGIATVIDFTTAKTAAVIRFIYFIANIELIKNLIEILNDEFFFESINREGKKLTMEWAETIGKRWTILYIYGGFPFIFQMMLVSLYQYYTDPTLTAVPLIFNAWHPFDDTKEPMHTIVFIMQSISCLITGYLIIVSDVFWYMVFFLLIGQFQVLAHTYKQLIPKTDNEDLPLPGYTMEVMLKTIGQHQKIRSTIGIVRKFLSPQLFIDFAAMLSLSFLLLDITISLDKHDWGRILFLSQFFLMTIIHVFAYNYLGNELAIQEEKLVAAMYEIPWHRSMKTFAVALTMTTSAARKPIRLTGCNWFNLTLEFFVSSMNIIFSYFMVLLQLRAKHRN